MSASPMLVPVHRVVGLNEGFPIDRAKDIEKLRTEVQGKEPTLRSLGELGKLQKMAATGELQGGLLRKGAKELLAPR